MMKMVSMKMTPEERKNAAEPVGMDAPEYPYGTRLDLRKEQVDALGLADVKVGAEVHIMAKGKIVSVRASEDENSERRDVEIQITDMACATSGKSPADVLYGKKEE